MDWINEDYRNPVSIKLGLLFSMMVASGDLMSALVWDMKRSRSSENPTNLAKFPMAVAERDCGADLSADTIEAQWQLVGEVQTD